MANVLNVLLKTINDVQKQNKQSKTEPTADKSVFDLLKAEIQKLDGKVQNNQAQNGKRSPKSILDLLKGGIEGVKRANKKDPAVETAPSSVFDKLLKQVAKPQQRQAASGIKKIVQDYNLDVSQVSGEVLQQIQAQYQADVKKFNHQYATAIFDVIKQSKKR